MNKTNIFLSGLIIFTLIFQNSCKDDYLNIQPPSNIVPENYLNDESQLAAYTIYLYKWDNQKGGILPTPGFQTDVPVQYDQNTDNQAKSPDVRYVPGLYKVPQTGGDWDFTDIYKCNYFMINVLPKWKADAITGNKELIAHYIGEAYFLRAYAYFDKLQKNGDFPIIKTTLTDNKDVLIAASKRAPRNEVARFIISDLDSAISLMKDPSPDSKKNRLSKKCALLLKSRVALFEGTWEKYFKGTAFVPNGQNWPGKQKDYNASYQFPSGSIDNEINYFLTQAMDAAKKVADAIPLVQNTGTLQQQATDPVNPYYDMFANEDMSTYGEVLLWRQYSLGLNIFNAIQQNLQHGDHGLTRGMVDRFLMANGLPIYATASGYQGDDSIQSIRAGRDGRLWLFLKEPWQKNVLYFSGISNVAYPIEGVPPIVSVSDNLSHIIAGITVKGITVRKWSVTGYVIRKGLNFNDGYSIQDENYTGSIVFRAVEAYLNYIEASYEKNGSIDATADSYWKLIRTRAGVDVDYTKTITATDLSKEAKNDWGTYSAGNFVDATMYNIRRERSCELMAEGLRFMDLIRWRAMDQMITTPYHIEGIKIWGPMQTWYPTGSLIFGQGNSNTVSDPSISLYFRPFEIIPGTTASDGYKWSMAHYLSPIAIQHFKITSGNNDPQYSSSPIYQNPGWPVVADQGAL